MRLVHSDTDKHSALLLSLLFLGKGERERLCCLTSTEASRSIRDGQTFLHTNARKWRF